MAASSEQSEASSHAIQANQAVQDRRARRVWRTWLSALATDSEAALAAALAYEALDDEARDAWLDVLEQDAPGLGIPAVALYAPLLAVELDSRRRERMAAAVSPALSSAGPCRGATALRGVAADGTHVCVVISPVYLDFVETLTCRYSPQRGFISASHDQLRHLNEVVASGGEVDAIVLEETPLQVVVEELAHAIVAEGREQREPPRVLGSFVHLFAPDFGLPFETLADDEAGGDRSGC